MPLTLYSIQSCCQWLPPVLELLYRDECRIKLSAQDASQAKTKSQLKNIQTSTVLMQTLAQGQALGESWHGGEESRTDSLCPLMESQNTFFSCLLNILWMWPEHHKKKLSWIILMKSWRLGEKIQEVIKESAFISHCVAAAKIKFWLIFFKSSWKWLYWPLTVGGFLTHARGQTSKRPRRYGQGAWWGEKREGVLM